MKGKIDSLIKVSRS